MSRIPRKKNLLLAFDAFGTLYQPHPTVHQAYTEAGIRHGIQRLRGSSPSSHFSAMKTSFGRAYKLEGSINPNYGKVTGLGAERWWANVIRNTFEPFLSPGQVVPETLVSELHRRYSTREGYAMFADVHPFFHMLREARREKVPSSTPDKENPTLWNWDRTIVGIISNSDDRVGSVLRSFGLDLAPRRVTTANAKISPRQTPSKQAKSDHDIDFVVLSYDVGHAKPDHRMFDAGTSLLREILLERGGAESDADDFEKVYVGDSLEHDWGGAQAAGWNGVLIVREGDPQAVAWKGISKGLETSAMEVTVGGERVTKDVQICRGLEALGGWTPS